MYVAFATEDDARLVQQSLLKLYRAVVAHFGDATFDTGAPVMTSWTHYVGQAKVDGETVRWKLPRAATVSGTPAWVIKVPSGYKVNGTELMQLVLTVAPARFVQFTDMDMGARNLQSAADELGVPNLDPHRPETFSLADWSRGMIAAMAMDFAIVANNQVVF